MSDIYVSLEETPLDITTLMQKVQSDAHGAIDLFIGTVRNNHQGHSVTGITYDAHEEIELDSPLGDRRVIDASND